MNIQLIQGIFNSSDTIELLTQMIQTKIRYHENKISEQSTEEDIKYRETKIKMLQKELYLLRDFISKNQKELSIQATITIE